MSHVGRVSARHLRVARRVGARTHHLTAARRAEARPTICRRVRALHAPYCGGVAVVRGDHAPYGTFFCLSMLEGVGIFLLPMGGDVYKHAMTCLVLIDESGDTGITKVRAVNQGGSSPYFTMAAVVLPLEEVDHARKHLEKIRSKISKRKWQHATDLNHFQTVFLANESAKLNCRFFGVISNKDTLAGYSERIGKDPQKFYNKCAVYLLECVAQYLISKGVTESPTIIFEKRNHNYDAMRRYIGRIKDRPMHQNAKSLSIINPFAILTKTKAEEDLFIYPDIVAHALFQCANKTPSNYFIPEPRYLRELSSRFGANEKGEILGYGIKPIHTLPQLELAPFVEKELSLLKARPMVKTGG